MARKRIDSIYDLDSIFKEAERLNALLLKQAEQIDKMGTVKVKFQGEGDAKKYTQTQTELSLAMKEFEKIQKDIATSQAKLNVLNSDGAKKLAEIKVQQQQINKENKESAREALGLTDAYGRLAKEYETAARAAQNLIITRGKDDEQTQKAIANAQELGTKLKDADSSVLKFQRNVGNYAGSLAEGFQKITDEISKLKSEQKGLQDLAQRNPIGFQLQGGAERLSQITSSLQQLNQAQQIGFTTNGNLRQQVKQLETAYQNMSAAGTQSNEFLDEFRKFTAGAKDQLEDLRGEIKALSSDTFVFDQLASSVKFSVAAFQVGASTAELFVGENEDVQKSIQELLILQNVANGVQELANQLTLRGSIINRGYVFVQNLWATATDRAAASNVRFNATLGLLGVAATVIGAIAIAVAAFRKNTKDTAESIDALAKSQEKFKEVQEAGRSELIRTTSSIVEMKAKIDLAKNGVLDKNTVLKEYNDTLGKSFGQVNNLNEAEQKIIDNTKAFVEAAVLRAQATKLIEQAAEKAADAFEIPETVVPTFAAGSQNTETASEQKKRREEENRIARERINNDRKSLEERAAALLARATQILKEKGIDFGDDLTSSKKDKKLSPLEQEIELLKQIAETEGFSASKRLGALTLYEQKKGQLIKDTVKGAEEEILKLQQLENEVGSIFDKIFKWENNEQIKQDLTDIVETTGNDLLALSEDSDDALNALGNKILEGVKRTSELIYLESQKTALAIEDIYTDSFQNIVDAAGNLFSGLLDGQKNSIQGQIDEIERLKSAEIDRINASTDSEEKKAAKIKIIEAKAQADREQLQRRQRQLSIQQAIAERALRAFQIVIDGQQASQRLQNEIALLRIKVAEPPPLGGPQFAPALATAVANLFSTRASTIASLIATLATPIPKFGGGKTKSDPYHGLGIVGEAGREIGIDSSGNMSLYTKPTLTYLNKGTTILPNKVTEDIINTSMTAGIKLFPSSTVNIGNGLAEAYEKENGKVVDALKRIEKKQGIILQVQKGFEIKADYLYHLKQ